MTTGHIRTVRDFSRRQARRGFFRRTDGDLLNELYSIASRNLAIISVLVFPTAGAIVMLGWTAAGAMRLGIWAVSVSVMAAVNILLSVRHRNRDSSARSRDERIIALIAGGTAWGALPFALATRGDERDNYALVCVVLVSVFASSAIFAAPLRALFYAFHAPMAVTAVSCLLELFGKPRQRVTLFVAFAALATCVLHALSNRAVAESVSLSIKNRQLAEDLELERAGLASSNRSLLIANERLAHIADHDRLTGLPNRAAFDRVAEELTSSADPPGAVYWLLFIDLDRFKAVNDEFGHLVGDCVLIEASRRISRALTDSDLAARLGGDEFVVLLKDVPRPASAIRLGTTILESLSEDYIVGGRTLRLSASAGLAELSPAAGSPGSLLRDADIALYRAKRAGRNRLEVHQPRFEQDRSPTGPARVEVVRGLDACEFRAWFQPVVDLRTREVVGAEALARWVHPERGVLAPGSFLEDVAALGLLEPLSNAVAADTISILQGDQLVAQTSRIHLNVDPSHLQDPVWLENLYSMLKTSGVSPHRIALEVTENAVIDDFAAATEWIERARSIGMEVYLDDFGVGYCSLGVLVNLPVDGLKIDLTFVQKIDSSETARAVIRATVQLAQELGLQIVAEGVETQTQADLLRDMGVRFAQGYLFSKAVPAEMLHNSVTASQ